MLSRFLRSSKRPLQSLSEQEILALAISAEEDDGRIYLAYADALRTSYPNSARVFEEMAEEESHHRQMLIDLHVARFGPRIPLIRREHVRDFPERKPDWLIANMPIETARTQAEAMEIAAHRFYLEAAARSEDAATRKLLGNLALAEKSHETLARRLGEKHTPDDVKEDEEKTAHRQFLLTYVQPGLAGLMDGSVSTLAPIFAAAFATQDTWQTFLVGLSASVGAGISMGFTEAAHDDGKTFRARFTDQARPCLRHHDGPWRPGTRPALSHSALLDRNDRRRRRRLRRALGHRLHPEQIHGNAVFESGIPGGAGWRAGAGGRCLDRQRLM